MRFTSSNHGLFHLASAVLFPPAFGHGDVCTVDDGMPDAGGDGAIDPSQEAPAAPVDEVIDTDAAPAAAAPAEEEPPAPAEDAVDPLMALKFEGFDPEEEAAPPVDPAMAQVLPALMPLVNEFRGVTQELLAARQFQQNLVKESRQQDLERQQRALAAAQAPKPPPPDAPIEDVFNYRLEKMAFEHRQELSQITGAVKNLSSLTEREYQERNKAAQQAQFAAQEDRAQYAFKGAVSQAQAVPGMEFLKNPKGAALAGVLWNTLRQESGGKAVDPRGIFKLMQEIITEANGKGQVVQRRAAEKTVLEKRRAAAQPPPPAPKAKAKPFQAPAGTKFPEWANTPDLQRALLAEMNR